MALDYYQIQSDLKDTLVAGPAAGYTKSPHEVFIEAMEREAMYSNMPFLNVRLTEAVLEERSLPNGYFAVITLEVDVASYDLSHFNEAATIRDTLLSEAQTAVQENRNFNGDVLTSSIGARVSFESSTGDGGQGHVAIATFQVRVEAYIEPTN